MIQTILDDLGIRAVRVNETRGPMATHAGNILQKMLERHGEGHTIMVLRTVAESEGNSDMLTAPVLTAISDLILAHPTWPERGLAWIEAFDEINLKELAAKAKANRVAVPKQNAIATMLYERLQPIFSPRRPARVRRPYQYKRGPRKPMQAEATL